MEPAHELILGGAKSGKSRTAEARAQTWLSVPNQRALLIATALAGDAEMAARIARHKQDRKLRVPQLQTLEGGDDLGELISLHAQPDTLVVVDCLTLWLTRWMMPLAPQVARDARPACAALLAALDAARGPVVCVSNEISLGGVAMSADARHFADALGLLHQAVAEHCARVTLMVAGCGLSVKGST